MSVKYKNTSSYRNTKQNEKFLDLYRPPIDISKVETVTIRVESRHQNRPDLLAYDLYREAGLWWVFTLFNRDKLLDPLFDLKSGMELTVPKNVGALGI
jgi:hypothetical protein